MDEFLEETFQSANNKVPKQNIVTERGRYADRITKDRPTDQAVLVEMAAREKKVLQREAGFEPATY
jgi:hypothetical protein